MSYPCFQDTGVKFVWRYPVDFAKWSPKIPVGSILKGKDNRLDEDEKTTYPRNSSTEE